MSGNVWEWTTSQWGKKTASPDFTYTQWEEQEGQRDCLDSHALRVVRGGSWYNGTDDVRCTVRYWDPPLNWGNNDLGFRIVLSSP